MDFYNTKMGHDFFCGTVPRIRTALEEIADTLRAGYEYEVISENGLAAALYEGWEYVDQLQCGDCVIRRRKGGLR